MKTEKVFEKIGTDMMDYIARHDVLPWHNPHVKIAGSDAPKNIMGYPYQGTNIAILSTAMVMKGYSKNLWATSAQIKKLGGRVNYDDFCGKKSTEIIKFNDHKEIATLKKRLESEGLSDSEIAQEVYRFRVEHGKFPWYSYSWVWNFDQCTGLTLPKETVVEEFDPIDKADAIIASMPNRPRMQKGGDGSYYNPVMDFVNEATAYTSQHERYSAIFHELSHSTGHESRLNRDMSNMREQYAEEELIAEMSACFVCNEAGILTDALFKNQSAYVKSWLRVFSGDPAMLVRAMSKAIPSALYILNMRKK